MQYTTIQGFQFVVTSIHGVVGFVWKIVYFIISLPIKNEKRTRYHGLDTKVFIFGLTCARFSIWFARFSAWTA